MRKIITLLITTMALTLSLANAQQNVMNEFPTIDVNDKESLQRGMNLYMDFCLGCHSLEAQRYNRTAKDIGIEPEISDKLLQDKIIRTGSYSTRNGEFEQSKVGDLIYSGMHRFDGEYWLGTAPPDLSTIVRAKGGDYIFQYLRSFYIDSSRPVGVNNIAFDSAGMPHVLIELQGEYEPIIETTLPDGCSVADTEDCVAVEKITGTKLIEGREGSMNEEQYRQVATDLTNFLSYVSEPAQIDRAKYGPWVLGFLVIFTILAYALNREYWRDVK